MEATLVFIRHSKSCANHVRHVAETEDRSDPLVAASQNLRDPALSAVGERMATLYGPQLRKHLADHGVSVKDALVGSSPLRRAQQTARLLLSVPRPHIFMHFGEHGQIPENTAQGARYTTPAWPVFLSTVHARLLHGNICTAIIVGHGSFLRSTVWPAISGRTFKGRVHNLDAFVVRGSFNCDGVFTPQRSTATYIPYSGRVKQTEADACALPVKIAHHSKMTRYNRKTRSRKQRSRKQRGGYVGMPLAYFKDGAQMQGTTVDPTGVGIGGTSANWAREAIEQRGGRRSRNSRSSRSLTRAVRFKQQEGGFSPSIMGSFAANGMRLLPVAAYMGYKMWSGSKKTRKAEKHWGRKTRRN